MVSIVQFQLFQVDGEKLSVQKRLILGNLREIFRNFREVHPEIKIGFSKFASLRPRNCVLAGSAGTHSVCVCTIHQNVKLMLESCKIERLTRAASIHIENYQSCLALGICNPPNISCYFSNCQECPGYGSLRELLQETFENNSTENITYNQWTSTDRSHLETIIQSTDDFIDSFIERLPILLRHNFVADQQKTYLRELKNNIKFGDVIVIMDFSENYSFVVQDKVQAYHWTNSQATIHPFAVYYRIREKSELQFTNFIVISDVLRHDTIAVRVFQRHLINFLKQKIGDIKK